MPPKRVLTPSSARRVTRVAPSGGDYSSVAAALTFAAAQSPSAANRWMVMLYPGTYNEDLALQNYVDVVGVGLPGAVTLNGRHTSAVCRLQNVTVDFSGGTPGAILTYGGSAATAFELVDLRASCTTAGLRIVDMTGSGAIQLTRCQFKARDSALKQSNGSLLAEDCSFEIDSSGLGYPFHSTGGTLFELRRCTLIGAGTNGAALYASASVATARLLHCTLRKGSAATYSIDTSTTPTITTVGCLANASAAAAVSGVVDLVVDAGI